MQAPIAKKIPHTTNIHSQSIMDNYYWLRDQKWPDIVDDAEILKYLHDENKYTELFFDKLNDSKEQLFEELKSRIKLSDISTYVQKDQYYYYTRTEEDKDYPIYCRKFGSKEAAEEIILDVNLLATNQKFTKVARVAISENQELMAYSLDFTGEEKYTIKTYDFKRQEYLKDEIKSVSGEIVWHKNLDGFFYVTINEKLRHDKVKFHLLGDDVTNDIIIWEIDDPLYQLSVDKSSSNEYVFINISGHSENEIYVLPMGDHIMQPKLIIPKKEKIFYDIEHQGDYFYIRTNDYAKNFCILRLSVHDTNYRNSYIGEESDKYLANFDITNNYIILNYKAMATPYIKIKHLKTGKEKIVIFPDPAFEADAFSTNFKLDDIRINYSSLSMPNTTYSYDFDKEHLSIMKTTEIPCGFDSEEYLVERIFANEVPITLLYKKSLMKKDGSNPLYLYGYGSYGISLPVSFRNSAISLVNRGFIFAIAHVRGGSELGHDWYIAAKFLNKKHTFNDFITCALVLIEAKYTSSGNIVICGGSAGGMLVGVALNERPELFKATIAHVPFVDVLNTMLDESLPLTPGEFEEWGNPKELDYFNYIQSYSPYDNVRAQKYPHLFITAGISDPRVGYWEPAKFVAKLRDMKLDDNILLLKTNMDSGHQGASGRFDYLKEVAEDLSFIFKIFM